MDVPITAYTVVAPGLDFNPLTAVAPEYAISL